MASCSIDRPAKPYLTCPSPPPAADDDGWPLLSLTVELLRLLIHWAGSITCTSRQKLLVARLMPSFTQRCIYLSCRFSSGLV
jgi:hypothetical protein